MNLFIILLIPMIALSQISLAQVTLRTISGRVQDNEGTPIANAILTLWDANRDPFAGTITDEAGTFSFEVEPGVYFIMETNVPGFIDVSPNEIQVDVSSQDSTGNLFVNQLTVPPTPLPTMFPTPRPTLHPTMVPTQNPTFQPTAFLTAIPLKTGVLRARKLQEVNTQLLDQEHTFCMDVDYDMFLVMEGYHLAGLASPTVGGTGSVSCPSVVLHSFPASDRSVVKESLLVASEEVSSFDANSKHYLGQSTLRSVMTAYDMASVGKDGAKFYDPITNNCVALLRNMADPLQVEIDDPMIDFVTDKLLDPSCDPLWEGIEHSPSLGLIVEGANRLLKGISMNKKDIVRRMIKLYI